MNSPHRSRSKQCLCATGIFLLLYSLAGTIIGYYFLNYYQQQVDLTSHLNLDLQSCSNICGYYTRQKNKHSCCDFYGSGCKSKQLCQQQRQNEYGMQVIIYQVVLGISVGYMSVYICYQIYRFLAAKLSSCVNSASVQSNVTAFQDEEGVSESGTYNRFKTQSEKTTIGHSQAEICIDSQNPMICSICLESQEKYQTQLICGHRFHQWCIRSWTALKKTCPVCRRKVEKTAFLGSQG